MSAQVNHLANVSHTKLDCPNSRAGSDIKDPLCCVSVGREISLAAECQEKLMILEICCIVSFGFAVTRETSLPRRSDSFWEHVNKICIGMNRRLYLITWEPVFCKCYLA